MSKTMTHVSSDIAYYQLERTIAQRVASLKGPLFTTDAISLWVMYLNGIPYEQRQHYNCNACKRFTDNTVRLAQACYNGDWDVRFILADSLDEFEDAPEAWSAHLRTCERHWQGCWVVDNVIGRR